MALLEANNIDTGYEETQILFDVSMEVHDDEIAVIIGPNGAGKSTFMKAVFGLIDCWEGEVIFDGTEITDYESHEITAEGLCYIPQLDNIFPSLTVRENLEMGAYILDEVPEDALQEVFDRFPILEERQEQIAGTMSGGQRQMLAMGRGLMVDPKLMLIDEPSAGLAPHLVDDVFEKIIDIKESGTAILMVEQNAKRALQIADRGFVLDSGENRFEDTGDNLLDNPKVKDLYLGG